MTGEDTADEADELSLVCVVGGKEAFKISVVSEDSDRGVHGTGRRGMGT
jgi:hypothetical protein